MPKLGKHKFLMSVANSISTDSAKELITLIEERDNLQRQLEAVCGKINAALEALARQQTGRGRNGRVDTTWIAPLLQSGVEGSPIGRRIFGLLEEKKGEGATIDEIVHRFHRSRSSVHVWFSSALRRNRGIVRIGPGRYALEKYASVSEHDASSKT